MTPTNGESNGNVNGQGNGSWDYVVFYRDWGFPKSGVPFGGPRKK